VKIIIFGDINIYTYICPPLLTYTCKSQSFRPNLVAELLDLGFPRTVHHNVLEGATPKAAVVFYLMNLRGIHSGCPRKLLTTAPVFEVEYRETIKGSAIQPRVKPEF